ncbi:MAG: hypothetical protein LBF51_07840 [Zoogloeaceae bacterium]|nr:hypothetical protein [Zoogloeaceae bacterium]
MKHGVWIKRLAGIFLGLALCGGAQAEADCDMVGDYRVAGAFLSEEFLKLARGMLAEAGKPSKDDGGEPTDDPVLSVRLTDDVFTVSTPGRSDTAKVPDTLPSGKQSCLLQLESSPDIWITRTNFHGLSDEQMAQLSQSLSYQWFTEVTPEEARSIPYFLMASFNLVGVTSGALVVPLEKIGEDAIRKD